MERQHRGRIPQPDLPAYPFWNWGAVGGTVGKPLLVSMPACGTAGSAPEAFGVFRLILQCYMDEAAFDRLTLYKLAWLYRRQIQNGSLCLGQLR